MDLYRGLDALQAIFDNPRVHTDRGYQRATKRRRSEPGADTQEVGIIRTYLHAS